MKPGQTLTIYSDGSWMVYDYVPYENRVYSGPGLLFPQTQKELLPQINFYMAAGGAAAIDDRRVQVQS